MDEKSIIRIVNKKSEISKVSELVQSFSLGHHLPNDVRNAIDLALDEILNNIISYGYDDLNEHEITTIFHIQNKQIIIAVEDDGRQFNPLDVPKPDTETSLEERPIGGLGIHLAKNIMDEIHYDYINKKNILTMKMSIRG